MPKNYKPSKYFSNPKDAKKLVDEFYQKYPEVRKFNRYVAEKLKEQQVKGHR